SLNYHPPALCLDVIRNVLTGNVKIGSKFRLYLMDSASEYGIIELRQKYDFIGGTGTYCISGLKNLNIILMNNGRSN
ncbi:hypothetical protein, partial [Lentibacillus salinarum]